MASLSERSKTREQVGKVGTQEEKRERRILSSSGGVDGSSPLYVLEELVSIPW